MTTDNMHVQPIETRLLQVRLVLPATLVTLFHPVFSCSRGVHDAEHGLGTTEAVVLANVLMREQVKIDALHRSIDSCEPVVVTPSRGGQEFVELLDYRLDAAEDYAFGRREAAVCFACASKEADEWEKIDRLHVKARSVNVNRNRALQCGNVRQICSLRPQVDHIFRALFVQREKLFASLLAHLCEIVELTLRW
jgi:hypothetical protein